MRGGDPVAIACRGYGHGRVKVQAAVCFVRTVALDLVHDHPDGRVDDDDLAHPDL